MISHHAKRMYEIQCLVRILVVEGTPQKPVFCRFTFKIKNYVNDRTTK